MQIKNKLSTLNGLKITNDVLFIWNCLRLIWCCMMLRIGKEKGRILYRCQLVEEGQ